jgi:iron complex transport system ATP-binding protein
MSVLRAEATRGTCVVVSLHDLGLAARFADRVIVLSAGRVAADGPPDEALRPAIMTQPVAWSRRP